MSAPATSPAPVRLRTALLAVGLAAVLGVVAGAWLHRFMPPAMAPKPFAEAVLEDR